MITVSDNAVKTLDTMLEKFRDPEFKGLRLQVVGGVPGAYQADFRLVKKEDPTIDDHVIDQGPFTIFISPEHAPLLEGTSIDVVDSPRGPAFKIDFPQPVWDSPIENKVQKVISDKINPGLASHGGFAALVGVEDGIARIVMGGGCQGCGLSQATLQQGIAVMIKEEIPEIIDVVDDTDHAMGQNPYYQRNSGSGKSAI